MSFTEFWRLWRSSCLNLVSAYLTQISQERRNRSSKSRSLLYAAALGSSCLQSMAGVAQDTPHIDYNFHNLPIVGGGFITGILFHPAEKDLAYCRTDIGGAYRWSSTDQHWIPLSDWVGMSNSNLLGIESIAIDPTDPKRLYLAAGTYTNSETPDGAMLLSIDQGRHFEVVPLPFKLGGNENGRFAGERLSVDPLHPKTLFFGSRMDGLWKSLDAGRHWQQVASFPASSTNGVGITFTLFVPSANHKSEAVYVGTSAEKDNLLRSQDGGEHWEMVPYAPTGLLPNHAQLSGDGWLYITYGNAPGPNGMTSGGVWKLDTSRGKWQKITPVDPSGHSNYGFGAVALDASNPAIVMVSTMDRWDVGDTLFRSFDAGKHWMSIAEQAIRDASLSPYLIDAKGKVRFGHWIGSLAIDPYRPGHVLYGTGDTIWSSTDVSQADHHAATHWSVGALGIEETAVLSLLSPPAGPHLFSGLGDIGCFKHEDADESSPSKVLRNPALSNCDSIDYAALHPSTLVRVGRTWSSPNHGGYSLDAGQTWNSFSSEPEGARDGGRVLISPDQSTVLWANRQGVFRSDDLGKHWNSITHLPSSSIFIAVDRLMPHTFYAYDIAQGDIYKSDDAGRTFDLLQSGLVKYGRLWTSPTESGVLWLSSKSGLYRSSHDLKAFSRISGFREVHSVGFGKPSNDSPHSSIFVAGRIESEQGVFRSIDDGKTWNSLLDTNHRFGWITTVEGDPRVFGRVYIGTNGRGVIVGEFLK